MPDPASAMQAQSRQGPAASDSRLARLLFDHGVGHFLAVRARKARSTLIISDRCYPDILVNPRRYGYGVSSMLVRLAIKLMPKPDLWILLNVPAKPTAPRDAEIAPTGRPRCGNDYPALLRGAHASAVDASQDVRHVVRDIDRAILAYLGRRTERRHAAGSRSTAVPAAQLRRSATGDSDHELPGGGRCESDENLPDLPGCPR